MPDRIFTPSPMAQGGGDLVSALLSGPAIREKARRSAVGDADAMLRAQIRANELRSREGLGEALTGLGAPADLATVLNAGAGNFQQGTAGLQNLADIALQASQVEQAGQPNADVAALNRVIAAREGKLLSPQQAAVVPLGEALVATQQARTGTEQARREAQLAGALVPEARADLLRRTDPNRPRGKAAAGAGDVAPSKDELKAMLRADGVPEPAIEQIVGAITGGRDFNVTTRGAGGKPIAPRGTSKGLKTEVDGITFIDPRNPRSMTKAPPSLGKTPQRMVNPETGEIIELRGGQWVKVAP